MAMNVETIEDGALGQQPSENNLKLTQEGSTKSHVTKWGLILLNCAFSIIGNTGGPLLIRLYYLHGGTRKWIASWIQVVGFPILLLPITFFYLRDRKTGLSCFAPRKLMTFSVGIGLMSGILGLTYSYGLSFLPVSTVTLLLSTNLVFIAFFAFFLVKQKFTPYSINTIVLMTAGAVLLGVSKNGDRLPGVSNAQYLLGFLLTIATAGLTGLMLPCTEIAFVETGKALTFPVVLQYLFGVNFIATIFCTVGMLINKDFQAIPREASAFELGMTKYYVILALAAVVWQLVLLGSFGLIFCTSSLSSGIFSAWMLPIIEVTSVIVFHEKFTGEKVMSMVLCLWGFASYFYGFYKDEKKQKQIFLGTEDK